MNVVSAAAWAAMREERDQLAAVLWVLRDGARNILDQYKRVGPMAMSPAGDEYYAAEFVLNDARETLQLIEQVLS